MPFDPILQDAKLDVHVKRGVSLRLQPILPRLRLLLRLHRSIQPQIRWRLQESAELNCSRERSQANVESQKARQLRPVCHGPFGETPIDQHAQCVRPIERDLGLVLSGGKAGKGMRPRQLAAPGQGTHQIEITSQRTLEGPRLGAIDGVRAIVIEIGIVEHGVDA
jgi:hypothetical protein